MAIGRKPIPNRLWKYRKLMGLRQTEVALRLGLKNTSMIARWERGISMPSGDNLLKLSKLYKTLANELYYELCLEFNNELFPEEYQDKSKSYTKLAFLGKESLELPPL